MLMINRSFRRIWCGESASMLGAQMVGFATPVFMATSMGLSPFEIAAVTAAGSAAPLVVSLSTGAIADRIDRRLILIYSSVFRAVSVFSLPVMYWVGMLNAWGLAAGLFVVMALTMLFDAALTATIPYVVPRQSLTRANSLMQAGQSAGSTVAPLAAGSLIPLVGAPFVYILNSVTYLISAFTVRSVPRGEPPRLSQEALSVTHIQDIKDGITAVLKHAVLRPIVLTASVFNFFQAWVFAVFVVYAVRELDLSPFVIGLMFTVVGVLGVASAVLAPLVVERFTPGSAIVWAFVLIALSSICVFPLNALGGSLAAVGFSLVFSVWEFCVVVAVVVGDTARQTLIEDCFQSRAASVERFATWGLDPIGALAGGLVASSSVGMGGSLTIASAGMAIPAIIAVSSRGLRALRGFPAEGVG